MIRRILVPLDGSDLANESLPFVADLVKRLKAEAVFIQVVGLPVQTVTWPSSGALLNPEFLSAELEEESQAAERYLSSLASEWQSLGIRAKWQVVTGPAGSAAGPTIVDFARANDVDMIAMSTHGRSGLSRLIFGSVAEHVVREAGIPVMLFRPGGTTGRRAQTATK